VNRLSVSEQLVYEIGDPGAYLLPDVACDWRGVELHEAGRDRVLVRGACGRAPPSRLKACATYADGWLASSLLLVCGDDAPARARAVGRAVLARANEALRNQNLPPLIHTSLDVIGAESSKC